MFLTHDGSDSRSLFGAAMASLHHQLLLLFLLLLGRLAARPRSRPPPFSQEPFLTVWNAPTARCLTQHGVDLDLGVFSIVHNQNQSFMGDDITIFYAEKLGLYPRYSGKTAVNGGVPQNASLDRHLRAASRDILSFIPDREFPGLAVVDWESWRPSWDRNWDGMRVYQEASRALVRAGHPEWRPDRVEAAARAEFEDAARNFMEGTLRLGQERRPGGLWGFYGFPGCYNYYSPGGGAYTGECPEVERKRNDRLGWLWNVSSALYPDIYLSLDMRHLRGEVLLYARHRVLEAARAGAWAPSPPPVFPYARIVYTYTLEFLSQVRAGGGRRRTGPLSERPPSHPAPFCASAGAPGPDHRRECRSGIGRRGAVGRQHLLQIEGKAATRPL